MHLDVDLDLTTPVEATKVIIQQVSIERLRDQPPVLHIQLVFLDSKGDAIGGANFPVGYGTADDPVLPQTAIDKLKVLHRDIMTLLQSRGLVGPGNVT